MPARKPGGQPGNENALRHGRHSKRQREQRRIEHDAEAERHRAWMRAAPKTNYRAICATMEATKATKH